MLHRDDLLGLRHATALITSAPVRRGPEPGKRGLEVADEVAALTADWLSARGRQDSWFLHVHLWDPHTPYRAPEAYGDPFAAAPLPAWLTEQVRAAHFASVGPHSAQEAVGFSTDYPYGAYPRQPRQIADMAAVRQLYDGYDTGLRFADDHIGRILEHVARLGIADDTAILISSDHGETLGELNVYGDHHTADEHTTHVPCILAWPGLAPRVDRALHYQFDVAATLVELLGGAVPPLWDGQSFAPALREGVDAGRSELVATQGAWTCQRRAPWDDRLFIHDLHDGYHGYAPQMLFDLARDPHQQPILAPDNPQQVSDPSERLGHLSRLRPARSSTGIDPLQTVLRRRPSHTRGKLPAYLERLRATAGVADRLARAHLVQRLLRD